MYQQSKLPQLQDLFKRYTKRLRSGQHDSLYGVIVLHPEKKTCPIVDDGLCGVQKNMGEDTLSDTCFVYPRQPRNFAGQYEQGLTLSCPEAARKALLTPDAMDFMVSPMAVRERVVPVKQMRGLTYPLMDEIRIFCMHLTRTQGITIWQRLAILGVFCEMLARTIAEDRGHAAVKASIESFTLMVQNGQILDALTGFKPDFEEQAKLFALLMNGNPPLPYPTHTEVRDAAIAGLGADDDGKVTLASAQLWRQSFTGGFREVGPVLA